MRRAWAIGWLGAALLAFAPSATAAPSPLDLVLPLKADLGGLQRYAQAVSTLGSPYYGDYAPLSELARRFGASSSTRARVVELLRRAGATGVRIDVTGLFADATFSARRAAVARIAPQLKGLITGIVGPDARQGATPEFSAHAAASQPSSERPRTGTPSGCHGALATGGFTPNQYLTAYGFQALHQAGLLGQGERVAVIETSGYKRSDVHAFTRCFALPMPSLHGFGVGFRRPLAPGGEASLDIEILAAAAPKLSSIDVYETRSTAVDVLRGITAPLAARQRPNVISASLGICEPLLYELVGASGIGAAEGSLQMAAASGITVLAASGDRGSADCRGANGRPVPTLAVNYPASSWWTTGVGGTNLDLTAANQISNEIVWNDAAEQPGAAGGGGASALFKRPDYQDGTVSGATRAVPDVSMLADVAPGDAIFCSTKRDCINGANHRRWLPIGGTSASTPLLAGGLALVDEDLRVHGLQELGLVNPLLYKIGSADQASVFHDVTAIGNDVGPYLINKPLGCCNAAPGYDEASGWGSLNIGAFAGAALSAQPRPVAISLSLPVHQHPLKDHQILATLSCSGPCLTAAAAKIRIGGAKPFASASRVARLTSAGVVTLGIPLSPRQLHRIRRHRRAIATIRGILFDPVVAGVLFNPGQSVQRQTAGRRLRIG